MTDKKKTTGEELADLLDATPPPPPPADTATPSYDLVARDPAPKATLSIDSRALVLEDIENVLRVARMLLQGGVAPAGCRNEQAVVAAILFAREVGLTPMQVSNGVMVIDGKCALYGDVAWSLILRSGVMTDMIVETSGSAEDGTLACTVKLSRDGIKTPFTGTFSMDDAKRAGLLGRGTWQKYLPDMLFNRARSRASRRGFADILGGASVAEELVDALGDTGRFAANVEPETAESDNVGQIIGSL